MLDFGSLSLYWGLCRLLREAAFLCALLKSTPLTAEHLRRLACATSSRTCKRCRGRRGRCRGPVKAREIGDTMRPWMDGGFTQGRLARVAAAKPNQQPTTLCTTNLKSTQMLA